MGIFTRLTDIINSNINAILDRAEDPEKIIRMIIQEMEDTLVEVRSGAARAIADKKDIARKLTRIEEAQAEWERRAKLAISKGRDDLAKGALAEKNKLADSVAYYTEELEHLTAAMKRSEEDVIKLDAKLREARAKKATIQARHKAASNHIRVKRNVYDNRIDEAFERFDKVEQRLDRMEGEVESYDLGKSPSLAQQIKDLDETDALADELAALKASVAKTTPKEPTKTASKK